MKPNSLMFTLFFALWSLTDGVVAQNGAIQITITDKEGNPHVGRKVIYNITGVSIDEGGFDVPLLQGLSAEQRLLTSDAYGRLLIPVPDRELNDPHVRTALKESKQITVHLFPQPKIDEPNLANINVALLLGDKPQDMHIVMMTARKYGVADERIAAAYESARGRFHLVGSVGTALYRHPGDGQWKIAEIEKYQDDEHFLYFQEIRNANRLWAFSRGALHVANREFNYTCSPCTLRNMVWLFDGEVGAWKPFSYASRIAAEPSR